MAWFKTDDQLPDHRKTRKVRKTHPTKRRDAAPFGIWVLAGAWSNDGFVPLEILEDWDDDAAALAERLVAAGLWHPTTRDGEPGYVFHDWHDQNPAKDDNDPSKSGSFGNHVRWHVQRQLVEPECDHCPKEPDADRGDHRPDIAPISPRFGGDIAPDSETYRGESLPSRPDPTRSRPDPDQQLLVDTSTETDEPDRFEEFWNVYGKKVKRVDAVRKWSKALAKKGVTADLLIAAAGEYVAYEREHNQGGRYIADPSSWLHGERWNDERASRQPPATHQGRAAQWLQLAADLGEPGQPQNLRQIGTGR
ncbi:hypothetical protein [Nocardioides kribbensis]|uniref:Uncharacterized protein n=1 Tax=Nocardioides kribbensis TaxID=305517 RepID=A0ABV1NZ23_9ACTN